MQNRVVLPKWLDDLIFEQLGAKYCRSNSDMTVIDWDKNDVLNYLGTYFPRSYAESYCIFCEFFNNFPNHFANKEEISIFDFGCGTGGEIIGFLTALSEFNRRMGKSPWISPPCHLTKYLSATEHEEGQVIDPMHLRS